MDQYSQNQRPYKSAKYANVMETEYIDADGLDYEDELIDPIGIDGNVYHQHLQSHHSHHLHPEQLHAGNVEIDDDPNQMHSHVAHHHQQQVEEEAEVSLKEEERVENEEEDAIINVDDDMKPLSDFLPV